MRFDQLSYCQTIRRIQSGIRRHSSLSGLAIPCLLVLSTALALSALAFRLYYSGRPTYAFLVKDLFLAWVPLGLALAIVRSAPGASHSMGRVARVIGLAVVWVLFLPNAPYLLTEFVHLNPQHRPDNTRVLQPALLSLSRAGRPGTGSRITAVPVWYDVFMILSFAWNGLLLALLSLRLIQQAVRERFGAACGWAATLLLLVLSGFGVTLGRFQRFNSWDLFAKPGPLLADVASRVFNPLAHPRTSGATFLLSAFLLLTYLTMVALMNVRRDESRAAGPSAKSS